MSEQFYWDKTSVKILSESNEIKSVSTKGRLLDVAGLDKHFVEVEAQVNSQAWVPNPQASVPWHVLKLGLHGDEL